MSDLLYFNGVNGTTGSYGLESMTAESLSDQILDAKYANEKKIEDLEDKLKQTITNRKKVLQIVKILAQRAVREPGEETVSQNEWLKTLAEELLTVIMESKIAEFGRVKSLTNKLEQNAIETIELIVKLLGEGNSRELSVLLLDKEPDDREAFKEKLKNDTRYKITDIQKARLGASNVTDLEDGDEVSRKSWLQALIEELKVLQIESLKALSETTGVIKEPLDTLVKALKALPDEARGSQKDWSETLAAALESLGAQGDRALWGEVINSLCKGLEPLITSAGDDVSWKSLLDALHEWLGVLHTKIAHLAAVEWVDPSKLDQAGWGIIFPAKMATERREAIKKALEPLLRLRLLQVDFHDTGIKDNYYEMGLSELLTIREDNEFHPNYQEYFKIYQGKEGYRPNDTASKFLSRFGARASDPADPEKIPYYLLLVGSPEEIPFDFQYGLDVQYAVGRIDFGDDYGACENYARNVVAAEQDGFEQTAKVTFFGVSSPDDVATKSSSEHLIQPLYEHFDAKILDEPWEFECIPPEQATKANLLDLMKQAPPAFLLTASHGMEFDIDDPQKRQEKKQGALLCSDWPGPNAERDNIPSDYYLSGQDVRDNGDTINLRGMIAFFFACYGAGTPLYDEYYKQAFKEKGQVIAERPFVADLPKAMLSLQQGGALAVVGHIERVWGTSFLGNESRGTRGSKSRKGEYVAVFESAIERLLKGHPIGSAMDYFNARYAAISTELTVAYDSFAGPEPYELAKLWTANNDARGYIVIGDPAVRLHQ